MSKTNALLFLIALATATPGAPAQDVVSYRDLKGTQFREYQMVMTIQEFDCEAKIGKKCRMTLLVENKGDRPESFNGTLFSIDNGKGSTYRAVPLEGQGAATLRREIPPGSSATFTLAFDGRIHFERKDPAHLRYGNASKVRIIK